MKKVLSLIAALAIIFSMAVLPVSAADKVAFPESIMPQNFNDPTSEAMSSNQSLTNRWFYWVQDNMGGKYEYVDDMELSDKTRGKVWLADHSAGGSGSYVRFFDTNGILQPNTEYVFSCWTKVNENATDWGSNTQGSIIAVGSKLGNTNGKSIVGSVARTPGIGKLNKGAGKWVQMCVRFTTAATIDTVNDPIFFQWAFLASGGCAWAYGFNVCKAEDYDAYVAAITPSSTPVEPDEDPDESAPADNDSPSSTVSFVFADDDEASKAAPSSSEEDNDIGISVGAVVGIVAGTVVVCAGIAAVVFFLVIKKKK